MVESEGRKSGRIYDSILTDEESDRQFDKVPDVPGELIERTKNRLELTIDHELSRFDPGYAKWMVARRERGSSFSYKEYRGRNLFQRAFDYLVLR